MLSLLTTSGARCQQTVTSDAVQAMQSQNQDFILIDVRSSMDFQSQHIQGAVNIPRPLISKAQLPKNKPVVLYCANPTCGLSYSAAKDLAGSGYDKVMVLDGGLSAWQSKSYPMTVSQTANTPIPPPVKRISARELNAQLAKKTFVILDVRPSAEFRTGHLPGAINIPMEDLLSKSSVIDQTKQVVVYDRNPQRSKQAAQQLQGSGFKVLELSGGISVWAAMKFPIEVQRR
jgi:rhodanese-related sulfurtransferase